MIYIGLGSNLSGPWGSPPQTLLRAIKLLNSQPVALIVGSSIYTSMAYGRKGVAAYSNAVVQIYSPLPPEALIKKLHSIEKQAARSRGQRWGARTLDIDLLDWNGRICGPRKESGPFGGNEFRPLSLPHPGILTRPFVALPLAEIAPGWHHPLTGETALQLANRLRRSREGGILARVPLAEG